MSTLDLSVVIPVHNEAPNLPLLHEELAAVLDGLARRAEIIFVDDGSTDGSAAVVRALRTRDARIRLVRLRARAHLSAAFDAGFRAAAGAIVVTLDADLQNDPRDIPRLLAALEGADAVTGWRHVRHDPWHKRVASRIGNGVRRRLTGDPIRDSACSLRAIRRHCLPDLRLRDGLHRFIPTLLRAAGHRVVEIPVNHRPRRHGTSKYGIRNRALVGLRDVLAIRWLLAGLLRYEAVEETAAGPRPVASRPIAPEPPRLAGPAAALAAVWICVAASLWAWGFLGGPRSVHSVAGTAADVAILARSGGEVFSLWVRWDAPDRAAGWVVLEPGNRWNPSAEMYWRRRVHPGWNHLIWPALPEAHDGTRFTLRIAEGAPAGWAVTPARVSAGYGPGHVVPLRGLLLAALLALGSAVAVVTAWRPRRPSARAALWAGALVAVAALGLLLRLRTLTSHGLWFDEILTAIGAQSLAWVLYTPQIFGHPPVQYLAGWLAGHGAAESVRIPFALAGAATVIALGVLGRRLLGSATGLTAAALLAVSPFHIELSQLARPYAFLLLLALASLLALVHALETRRARAWLGWAALAALTCYTHYLGLLVFLVMAMIAATWIATDRGGAASAALAFGLAGTLLLPWTAVLGRQAAQHVGTGSVAPNALADLLTAVVLPQFVGGGHGTGAALTLAAGGLGLALWQRPRSAMVALLWLGPPLVIIWAAQPYHFLAGRHLGFLFPVLLLLIAHGATAIGAGTEWLAGRADRGWRRSALRLAAVSAGAAAGLMLAAPSAAGLSEYYRVRHGPDWRSVAEELDRLVAPGERVVARLGAAYPLRHYWNADAVVEMEPTALDLPRGQGPGQRIWIVVLERWDDDPNLAIWLERHAVRVGEVGPSWSLPRVFIYRARPAPPSPAGARPSPRAGEAPPAAGG
ncbi:MAG TPA: glycosyltransferase [Candidatus Binatia bacterium]|nr:glycosyltransferase [Candidatus Binatia bacterium]